MFGLGTKKDVEEEGLQSAAPVSALPAEFYGGANPTVTFKAVTKVIERGGLTAGEKKALDRATAAGSGEPLHPANLFTSRRFIIVAVIALFALFTGGASWYYIRQASPPAGAPPAVPAISPPIVPVAPRVEEPAAEETAATAIEATSTPSAAEAPAAAPAAGLIEFPSLVLGSSQDSDRDGLSDPEEELFRTDPAAADSDGDTYLDGSEIYHLYSPVGKEPQKLVDSGLIKEFVNPVFGYQLYYPSTWAVGNVDQNYRDMLFSTLTGENIEIRVFDTASGQSFADWFSALAPAENINVLADYNSVFKERGLSRADGLVFYFPRPNQIVVLAYHPAAGETVANYRAVISMMAQSFRSPGNGVSLPPPSPSVVFDVTSTPATSTQPAL